MATVPAHYDFYVRQGETLSRTFTLRDADGALVNLTGYTAGMQVRKTVNGDAVLDLTQLSGITLGGAAGTVVVGATAATTTDLDADIYKYDLFLTSGAGVARCYLEGGFTVSEAITHA